MEEPTKLTCITTGRNSSLEDVTVRLSCFGLRKKAKPLPLDSKTASWSKKDDPSVYREDSAEDVTHCANAPGGAAVYGRPGIRQDDSPRNWGYGPSALEHKQKEPTDLAEQAHPASSDDEGTHGESSSDGNAPLGMHDSTSSLKEGLFNGKGKKDIFAAAQADKLDEEEEEDSYLMPEWEINPHDIFFCSRSNGKLCRLGKGAFGTVYKGVWKEETVAVKVCRQQHITVKAMKQFQKEVAILYGCHNESIVQFKGACCWKGGKRTVLVTEYMEKGDLCTALGRAPAKFTWGRLGRSIALDVARGLAFLHADNIVHFDLKSANILLDRHNRAKLADVGLAKTLTHYHGSDHLSTFMATGDLGTFAWAAPEVLLGFPCNSKADIFSFGVVMWELVTTEMPQGRCLRPIRVPEEAPEEVATLIMDCLRHDPAARPTAQDLVHLLTHMISQA